MAPKRPRLSVGVMAMCCGFLSLVVVAREATSDAPGDPPSSRVYAPVQHPGASAPPTPQNLVESKRHRKTRETFPPLTRPATADGEYGADTRAPRHRRMEPQQMGSLPSRLVFVPSRGRRYGTFGVPAQKRQLTIEQMLEKGDYFVPNRGKKAPVASGGGGGGGIGGGGGDLMIKKGKFDVLLGSAGIPGSVDEYFFPNRGKKEYYLASPAAGSGKLVGVVGESRLRRNLLENLANDRKDTFFSSRGKRILAWPGETPLPAVAAEERGELLPEGTGGTEPDDFSAHQRADIDEEAAAAAALLWNDALPLFPVERASSS